MDRFRTKSSTSSPVTGEEESSSHPMLGLRSLREQATQRLGQVVATVKRWWSKLSAVVAPTASASERPEDLARDLKKLGQQLAMRESALVTSLDEANQGVVQLAVLVADKQDKVISTERSRDVPKQSREDHEEDEESEEQILAQLNDLQRQQAETIRSLARDEPEFELRERFNDLAKAEVSRAEKRIKKLKVKIASEPNELKRERLQTRLKTIKMERRIRRRAFEAIASVNVPWKLNLEFGGEQPSPPGMFAAAIPSLLGPATIVGAGGGLSEIDWENPETAIAEATELLVEQTPPIIRGGRKKHVGHFVIGLPLLDGEIPFVLTPETAMRLARQGLLSQGADPDLHDFVVFVHQKRKANGDDHDEEAVHVLWSKVRVDGKYLINDNALISAVVGRVRWDRAAGFDDQRLGAPGRKHACVRRGFRILNKVLLGDKLAPSKTDDGVPLEIPVEWDEKRKKKRIKQIKRMRKDPSCLAATYRGGSRTEDETVDFFGREFLERLAGEGLPDPLFCAGVWTPKKSYCSGESIASILTHLYGGK